MNVSHTTWHQLSGLLDEALDLPPPLRASWLERQRTARPDLAPSLDRLLAAHATAETADVFARLPTYGHGAQPPTIGAGLNAGDTVGPYRLIRELGSGGMADVWLAERSDGAFERRVAVKLPRVSRLRSDLAARFARERDILARLEHPNIARLYDAGIAADGLPYLAMEFVDGVPITTWCDERRLDSDARLRLYLQVLDAVQYAHANLVIHRDLKPSNILVTFDGQVRLLDFGIAKLLADDDTARETQLTQLAGRALTPDYASPEQIKGDPLSIATDIYSIGVVLFELLTGGRPYRLQSKSITQIEQSIASADALRASEVAATPALRSRMRGDLDAMLNKALKKDPAERYATALALADDIERHLTGNAVLAQPDSRLYRTRKFVHRYRLAVVSVVAVIVALGAGLSVALWQADQARLKERQALEAADRESVIQEMYLETLSTVAAWDPATFSRSGSVARELKAKLEDFDKRNQARPARRLALLNSVAAQLPTLGDDAGALEVSQRYLALLKETRASSERQLEANLMISLALVQLGRNDEAEGALRRALVESPPDANNLDRRSSVIVELAKLLSTRKARMAEARRLLEDPTLQVEKLGSHSRWEVRVARARLLMGYDDPEALRVARQAQEEYAREPTAFPSNVAHGDMWLGFAALYNGRATEAEQALRKAGRIYESVYGPTDRDSIFTLGALTSALAAQGRHEEARQLLVHRMADVDKRPGDYAQEHRAMLTARLLENDVAAGDAPAALAHVRIQTSDAPLLFRNPELSVYVKARARVLNWNGRAEEAVNLTRAWIDAMPTLRLNSPAVMHMRLALAESELSRGQGGAALMQLDELLAAMREHQATRTWLYHEATEWAALAQARLGDPAAALARLQGLEQAADAPPTASSAARTDSLLRRAEVFLAAGRNVEAAAALNALPPELETQHVDSPRRAAAHQLQVALDR